MSTNHRKKDSRNYIIPILLIAVLAIVAYFVIPGARRTATQTWQNMSETELKENWEFYYDEAITNLESKLGAQFERQIDSGVALEKAQREVRAQEDLVAKTEKLLRAFVVELKAQGDSASGSVEIQGRRYESYDAAKRQARRFAQDLLRERERLGALGQRSAKLMESDGQLLAISKQLKARIREMKDQKEDMRTDLEISKIRKDLLALSDLSQGIGDDPDIKQLQKIQSVIDGEILRTDVAAKLQEQDQRAEGEVLSARQALESMQDHASSSEADALLEGLLAD